MAALTGKWTYRSFLNNSDPVSTPDEAMALIFGEGELDIVQANPENGFTATLSFGGNAIMDLTGQVAEAAPPAPQVINAKGRGRPGGPISAFAYDYIFYEVPDWPEGRDQRQALVGTVIRAEDHGQARKGATATTITVRQIA